MKRVLWILVLSGLTVSPVCADTVVLKNGERLEGVVARDMGFKVKVEHYVGAGLVVTNYSPDEVEKIIVDREANRDILTGYREARGEVPEEPGEIQEETGEGQEGAGDVQEEEEPEVHEEVEEEPEVHEEAEEEPEEAFPAAPEERTPLSIRKASARERQLQRENEERERELAERQKKREAEREAERIEWMQERLEKMKEDEIEEEQKSLRFGKVRERINTAGWHIYNGTVHNDGKRTKKYLVVRFDFFDRLGNFLQAKSVFTEPRSVRPGEKATFVVTVVNTSIAIAKYEKFAVWTYDPDEETEDP